MAGITSPNVITVRRRFIAAKYKADERDKRSPKPSYSLSKGRVGELERLYEARYGHHLPDDDAGRDDLVLIFNHIANVDACIRWAAKWAPWMPSHIATTLGEQVTSAPLWLKAGALGERVRLTDAERTRLKIKTIRPIEAMTDEALAKLRKRKDRERKALERQIKRATKPVPASQTKPWESEGIDRATWYRRRRAKSSRKRATKSVRNNTVSITADRKSRTTNNLGSIVVTTPPAIAVGTPIPSKTVGGGGVEGAALVGSLTRRFKTRFPTSLRITKEMKAYALAACFKPDKIERMFEMFRNFNLGERSYSADWDQVWFNWVDREVDLANERYERERRRAYFERRAA
jgi:hypothetical protein